MLDINIEGGGSSRRGLSEFECEALGLVVFTKSLLKKDSNDQSNESSDCPICLVELQDGVICRMLPEPCGHIFHQQCIDQWFKQSTVCPLCKRSMKMVFEEAPEEERNHRVRRHVAESTNTDSAGRIRDFMNTRRHRREDHNQGTERNSGFQLVSTNNRDGTYDI